MGPPARTPEGKFEQILLIVWSSEAAEHPQKCTRFLQPEVHFCWANWQNHCFSAKLCVPCFNLILHLYLYDHGKCPNSSPKGYLWLPYYYTNILELHYAMLMFKYSSYSLAPVVTKFISTYEKVALHVQETRKTSALLPLLYANSLPRTR